MLSSNEALRFFRKNRQFKQKELLNFSDPSAYSRIENGQRAIKLEDLINMLNRLSVTFEEFIFLSDINKEQRAFDNIIKKCAENPQNKESKQMLINYYNDLHDRFDLDLRELSNYLTIKTYFPVFWKEIEKIKPEETKELVHYFSKKEYYLHYDYRILSNILIHLTLKQSHSIVLKALSADYASKAPATQEMIRILANNAITKRIYEKDFNRANEYIELVRKHDPTIKNIEYSLNIQYYSDLVKFLETSNLRYLGKIQNYIEVLQNIGAESFANSISAEVSALAQNSKDTNGIIIFPFDKR